MHYRYRRLYAGPPQAVIFDWAGTTVDYGSAAPAAVFVELFRRHGVEVTPLQAREPMGTEKKAHIRAIARQTAVAARWREVHGQPCGEDDIEAMYRESVELQAACVAEYAALIPGTLATIADCRARGMRIGSTTGYSRPIMDVLAPAAARQGYAPDSIVCASDVPAGRPAPWMAFRSATELGIYPMAALVKVGDTVPDIEEGLNAGMWTIGLTKTGNELGLTAIQVAELEAHDLAARLTAIGRKLRQAGAHYVTESIADVPEILDDITARLRRAEQP